MKLVVATESFDAHAVMAGLLAGVADRGARIDGALALDRAGAGEDALRGAWSCRSGTGPPARCTGDPWLVCRSVPCPPPKLTAAFLRGRIAIVSNRRGIGKRRVFVPQWRFRATHRKSASSGHICAFPNKEAPMRAWFLEGVCRHVPVFAAAGEQTAPEGERPASSLRSTVARQTGAAAPHGIVPHGRYAWLRAENWRDVIRDSSRLHRDPRLSTAENDYADAFLAPLAALRASWSPR